MAAKRRRRKGRYGFLLALLAVLACIILFVIMSGLFFKVSSVRVEGVSVYRESEIVEKTGFTMGENIFLINKIAAIRAIRASFPYTDSVKIKRELPGTVVIVIQEKAPVVMIQHENRYWYMDMDGILLESIAIPPADTPLPLAKGLSLAAPVAGTAAGTAEGDEDKLSVLLLILKALLDKDLWRDTDWIDLQQISNPSFRYLDRITVMIGAPEQVDYKLSFMQEYIRKYGDTGKGSLDLSSAYDSGAIRFRPD